MYSERFAREVRITRHARGRMLERAISDEELGILIEKGKTRYKDEARLWIAHYFEGRRDNLLCTPAVVEADALVIKTAMHHFSWEG